MLTRFKVVPLEQAFLSDLVELWLPEVLRHC